MLNTKTLVAGLAVVTLGLGACSSTQVTRVASAAPITYKVGGPTIQRAALTTPDLSHRAPLPYAAPRREALAPASLGPEFDPRSVDRELYAHQRVGKRYRVMGQSYKPKHQPDFDESGVASWYGPKFNGKPTASGEIFDMNDMTGAHRTLPLNSLVHVTNLETGRMAIVRINDRGPFVDNRIIDLSKAAAVELGLIADGLGEVRVRYAGPADPNAAGKRYSAERASQPTAPAQPTAPPNAPLSAERLEPAPTPAPYVPLREQIGEPAPMRQVPSAEAPVPSAPQIPAPQITGPMAGDDVPAHRNIEEPVTLTIKGPIRMATHTTHRRLEYIHPASTPAVDD